MAEFQNHCLCENCCNLKLNWFGINFQIKSQEEDISEHSREFIFTVKLKNWNDEFPIFDMSEYSIDILETFEANQTLTTITATDRDIDDKVM